MVSRFPSLPAFTEDYTYDPASQVTAISHQLTALSQQINKADYLYNGVGNRTQLTDRRGAQNFGYDNLDRLTSASHPLLGTPQSFAYDPVGNRTTAGNITNAGNQLTADATHTYQYDDNGNLTRKTLLATGHYTQYTYDAENRLTKVEDFVAGASTAAFMSTYRYDGLGRRIEKVANGQTKRYVYDGEDILLEYDGANVLQARYTHGPGIDEPIAVTKGGSTFFYHQDGLGSVTDLTDSAGATAKSYGYDAYGTILESPGTVEQPYTYTGREFDSESGLVYYRARYYDPSTGRFLEKDPIGFSGGDINLYNYAFNSPLLYTDPYGLEVQVCRQPALGFLPVDHQWIKTDTLERGMGGTRGNVAGNQSGDWPGDPVQITDHSGRSNETGASCKAVDNVDENKVNELLELGRPLGRWTPGNQCQSFVGDVLKKSRNSPGASGKWEGGATGNW